MCTSHTISMGNNQKYVQKPTAVWMVKWYRIYSFYAKAKTSKTSHLIKKRHPTKWYNSSDFVHDSLALKLMLVFHRPKYTHIHKHIRSLENDIWIYDGNNDELWISHQVFQSNQPTNFSSHRRIDAYFKVKYGKLCIMWNYYSFCDCFQWSWE